MKISQHFDDRGNHRLVATMVGPTRLIEGEWTGYQAIASLLIGVRRFITVTDYHEGGLLKAGQVYELSNWKN